MGKITYGVLAIITLTITIFLFYFIVGDGEKSNLFYLNLYNTCFLELVFFGTLLLSEFKTRLDTTVTKIIFNTSTSIYIVSNFVVMIFYSLILKSFISNVLYISAEIIITLIWIVFSTISAKISVEQSVQNSSLQSEQFQISVLLEKMRFLDSKYNEICNDSEHINTAELSDRSEMSIIIKKFKYLTPNVIRDINSQKKLEAIVANFEDLIGNFVHMDGNSSEQKLISKIKQMSKQSVFEIESMKSLTRN